MPTVYQCVIEDNYTHSAEQHETGSPESASYWPGLQMAEVPCPVCAGSAGGEGYLDDGRECPECEGSGLTSGEPFTVYRYDDVPEDVAEEMCDAPGDGHEWTDLIFDLAEKHGLGEGVLVLEWEPERASAEIDEE
jgi:DnaJ-class molecular chaperone